MRYNAKVSVMCVVRAWWVSQIAREYLLASDVCVFRVPRLPEAGPGVLGSSAPCDRLVPVVERRKLVLVLVDAEARVKRRRGRVLEQR